MSQSPVRTTVDFDAEGVQHGHLKIPYSGDDSAWGAIMIPVTVVKNDVGPTVIFTGANHGDEYEGPIALWWLSNELKSKDIRGRVIIVPAMNYPAFKAGKRTSPIDGGNMNRTFPGRPDGTITEIIADYFNRVLLPMADYVADMHSGGKTLDFVPFACAHVLENKHQQARCIAAMEAFNAPYSLMLLELDSAKMYDTAAEKMGKVFIGTELGGGGSASATTVAIAKRGILNLLKHAGILSGEPERGPSISLVTPDHRSFVTSEHSGLLEMCVDLGADVKNGEVIALVHDIERTGTQPVEYKATIDGVLAGRHYPSLTQPGDNLAVIAIKS
ncbi:MAG TPA: N-alpha-acetyl diaminobutyric acid deacetylase DoeB [Alphaproteobacteria bacterium]|jgi:N-alpha-acetyl-L-2,4-diaminobutyrate deacetylase|nr:N-alpha-acetyl diaminobutyric acid deacetylase DoeB [Alphaproteobacteria bacterium]